MALPILLATYFVLGPFLTARINLYIVVGLVLAIGATIVGKIETRKMLWQEARYKTWKESEEKK